MPRGDKPTTVALALKDGWVYEDALPEMTKEQYDWWFKESLVLDGVRMGPPLTTQNTTDNEPGEALEPKDFDEPHRWEVEPHPWDSDYDIFVTDDDEAAREAILHAAEMHLWDGNNGEERTLRVKMDARISNVGNPSRAPLAAVEGDALRNLLNQFLLDKYGCTIEHYRMKVLKHFVEWAAPAAAASSAPAEPLPSNEQLNDYVTLLERNNGRLRKVLKEALDQTGCDGDLCNYRWHEKARVLLGEDEQLAVPAAPLQPEGEQDDPMLMRMRIECELRHDAALSRLLEQGMSEEDAERQLKQEGY